MSENPQMEQAFQDTFRIIFGQPCKHTLDELKEYMLQYHYPTSQRRSVRSAKTVTLADDRYAKEARFISQDEIDFSKRAAPLDINQIKDIDSIVQALSERFEYAGSKTFGKCENIERADNCTDSFQVQDSHSVVESKNVAYSSYVRDGSDHVFGSGVFIRSKYLIKVLGAADEVRAFETYFSTNNSDMFFCFFCHGCAHTMFSFNQRAKRYCIGNRELPKEKYFELRKKLLEESREYLEKHKRFYSIFDFGSPNTAQLAGLVVPAAETPRADMRPMEEAFALTTKLVIGKSLGPLASYEKFLSSHIVPVQTVKSPLGGEVAYSDYFWCINAPKNRLVNHRQAERLGGIKLEFDENTKLADFISKMDSIAYYCVDFSEGENVNNPMTPTRYFCRDTYRIADATYTKRSAYCTHGTGCEAVFGCGILSTRCKFCIRCHDCIDCTSSMDLDSCKSCSDCLFCHNCENMENCMFCFNAKSLRYAIGNVEVGKEKFMQVKKRVQEELASQLEKTGDIRWDICRLGAKR